MPDPNLQHWVDRMNELNEQFIDLSQRYPDEATLRRLGNYPMAERYPNKELLKTWTEFIETLASAPRAALETPEGREAREEMQRLVGRSSNTVFRRVAVTSPRFANQLIDVGQAVVQNVNVYGPEALEREHRGLRPGQVDPDVQMHPPESKRLPPPDSPLSEARMAERQRFEGTGTARQDAGVLRGRTPTGTGLHAWPTRYESLQKRHELTGRLPKSHYRSGLAIIEDMASDRMEGWPGGQLPTLAINREGFILDLEEDLHILLNGTDQESRRVAAKLIGVGEGGPGRMEFDMSAGPGAYDRTVSDMKNAPIEKIRRSISKSILNDAHARLGPDVVERAGRLAPVLEQAREVVEEGYFGPTQGPRPGPAVKGRERFLRPDLSTGEVEDLVNTRSFERMYGMASKAGALAADIPKPIRDTVFKLGRIGLWSLWPISVGLLTKDLHRISKIKDPEARKRELLKLGAMTWDPLSEVRTGISQKATAAGQLPPGTAESRQQAARKALSPAELKGIGVAPSPSLRLPLPTQTGWKEQLAEQEAQPPEEPGPTIYEEMFPITSQPSLLAGYPEVSMRKSAAVRALEEERRKQERK